MPTIPTTTTVVCLNCRTTQEDLGKRTTCIKCGFQPIPSYSYTKDNVFHPRFTRRVAKRKSLKDMVAERRAQRNRN
ncbi:hypothetical protein M0R72_17685 [Candidatus Pacearchaeota archaeon]|jgi:hypothetical protein|nr:hypothetical protein [Candidatus Pacearchaeota archaeon]